MDKKLIKYNDVSSIVQLLLNEVKKVLKSQFIGMYIHGSLAIGDFNIYSSDIDFFVVTKDVVSKDLFIALEEMHKHIVQKNNRWANRLEGSYVCKEMLKSKEPPNIPRPYINGGEFSLSNHGYEWIIELYTIREDGIIIEGPRPKELINPISSKELKQASLRILNEWWAPMLSNTSQLENCEYQAYSVLTMCRILYMVEYGAVVSKRKAGKWASGILCNRWSKLIEQAMLWKKGEVFNNINETMKFIRFTIEFIKNSGEYRPVLK